MKKIVLFLLLFFAQSIVAQTYIDYNDCEELPKVKADFVKELCKCFNFVDEETVIEVSFFIAKDGNTFSPVADVPGYADCMKKVLEKIGKFTPCRSNGVARFCFVKFKVKIKL